MRVIVLPGKNIAMIPNNIKIRTATNKTPPITVKSHLVWNANSVSPRQTAAVIPTAKRTYNKETFYYFSRNFHKNQCYLLRSEVCRSDTQQKGLSHSE